MKRNNIYLYDYSNGLKGSNIGFCRMDVNANSVKLLLNIKNSDLGINPSDVVDIKCNLVTDGGELREFICSEDLIIRGNAVNIVSMSDEQKVVGVMLEYQKKNGIKIKLQGSIDNKECIIHSQNVKRIEQIELEDTVYNVDTECLKEKKNHPDTNCEKAAVKATQTEADAKIQENVQAEDRRKLIKIGFDEITTLPRECWKIMKNKFVICGCNRYGHLAYMKEQGRHIICVPGVMNDKSAMCARRYGFKSYVLADEPDAEGTYNGYWMMSVTKNSKL